MSLVKADRSAVSAPGGWRRQCCQGVGRTSFLQLHLAAQQVALQRLVCTQVHWCQQLGAWPIPPFSRQSLGGRQQIAARTDRLPLPAGR